MTIPIMRVRSALTGGASGALDETDGALLNDGDPTLTVVPATQKAYVYVLDADSAAAESSPAVVSPDANAGDKRHVLAGLVVASLESGPSAPALLWKELTGTTANSEGGTATVAHGLTASKVYFPLVSIYDGSSTYYFHDGSCNGAGRQFSVSVDGTNLIISNHPSNSENILSKAFKAIIFYKA